MSTAAIIQRLETLEALSVVEPPSRTNPLERNRYPVATVYPLAEVASEDGGIGAMTRMMRAYTVLLTVDSADSLEQTRDAVARHLIGWKPANGATPLKYTSGKVEQLSGSLIQWAMQLETTVCYSV